MSFFGIGGTVGFAVGPLMITAALLKWDLKGTLVLIIPAALMALVLLNRSHRHVPAVAGHHGKESGTPPAQRKDAWGPFSRLTLTVIGRSILFYGLNTFIPIYWITVFRTSEALASAALTVMAASGIAGNLLGGRLADKWGQNAVIKWGFCVLTGLLPVFVLVRDPMVAMALLVPIGLALFATYSPMIVLGQKYLPNRIGLSSGVTLGVAVAIGGGFAPVLGKLADLYGVKSSLAVIAVLPLPAVLLSFSLPDPDEEAESH